jgi:hypothetical protein
MITIKIKIKIKTNTRTPRTISILPRAAVIDLRAGVWKGKTCNPVPVQVPIPVPVLTKDK